MANNNDSNESRWVEERLGTLETPGGFQPDVAGARIRLREREAGRREANPPGVDSRRAWRSPA